jgi:hypothetical protein
MIWYSWKRPDASSVLIQADLVSPDPAIADKFGRRSGLGEEMRSEVKSPSRPPSNMVAHMACNPPQIYNDTTLYLLVSFQALISCVAVVIGSIWPARSLCEISIGCNCWTGR